VQIATKPATWTEVQHGLTFRHMIRHLHCTILQHVFTISRQPPLHYTATRIYNKSTFSLHQNSLVNTHYIHILHYADKWEIVLEKNEVSIWATKMQWFTANEND